MDKNIDIPMLLDIYGSVLPKVQYDSLDLYYNEDFSLSEIADNTGKSRQSVFDALKRGESSLRDMEIKLGFLKKSERLKRKLDETKAFIRGLKCDNPGLGDTADEVIEKIDDIIHNLA